MTLNEAMESSDSMASGDAEWEKLCLPEKVHFTLTASTMKPKPLSTISRADITILRLADSSMQMILVTWAQAIILPVTIFLPIAGIILLRDMTPPVIGIGVALLPVLVLSQELLLRLQLLVLVPQLEHLLLVQLSQQVL